MLFTKINYQTNRLIGHKHFNMQQCIAMFLTVAPGEDAKVEDT